MPKSLLIKLKPVESETQVDKIENALQTYFVEENLQPGDLIPSEIELATSLNVSRTAVREALSRFKTLGIIESKRNRGIVISNPDIFSNMKRILNIQLLDEETMKEIFEMRLVLEMGIIDLLFLRKNDTYLNELGNIVEKESKTKNRIERLKLDAEFHALLYKISGNRTIQRFQKILLPVFDYVNNVIRVERQKQDVDFVSHKVLLDTLKNGTPEEFRVKMKNHLLNYFEKIKFMAES